MKRLHWEIIRRTEEIHPLCWQQLFDSNSEFEFLRLRFRGAGSTPGARGASHRWTTANLPTNIVDVRGFDSSIMLILRGGIPRPKGVFLESLSQAILVVIILVGRLGVQTAQIGEGQLHPWWERRIAARPSAPENSTERRQRYTMFVGWANNHFNNLRFDNWNRENTWNGNRTIIEFLSVFETQVVEMMV